MTNATLPATFRIPSIISPVFEFLFPPVCFVCGGTLVPGEEIVCTRCWSTVQPVRREDPLYRATLQRLTEAGPLTDLVAGYYFATDGVLQALLHLLKYEGMTRIGEAFGKQLGALLSDRPVLLNDPALVPVPLHRSKRRERGYNQSERICKGLASVTGLAMDFRILRRHRYTRSQTGLGIGERKQNVDGAFELQPSAAQDLRGRSFLLVDDVVTTGSTIEACATVLRAHGADQVAAAVIAIAP
jgi:ComF family protein